MFQSAARLSISSSLWLARLGGVGTPTRQAVTARPVTLPLARQLWQVKPRCASLRATHGFSAIASAATIRALDVSGVAKFVVSLGVDSEDAQKLSAQKVDGAALLNITKDDLRSFGVPFGSADAILRAISPAVSEIADAQRVSLTVYPPLKRGESNNPIKISLTRESFIAKYVNSGAPLRLVSADGAVLRELTSLDEAIDEQARHHRSRLRTTRAFDDELAEVRGFVARDAEAVEQESTRALASDSTLEQLVGGLLTAVNSAEHFSIRQGGRSVIEIDGLVVGKGCALLNSAKHSPTLAHVRAVVDDAAKLLGLLLDLSTVTTDPVGVKSQLALASVTRVLPFLSGAEFSALVEAECHKLGVSVLRPSGERFAVEVHPSVLPVPAPLVATST